jgi:hypothetical protein
LIEHPAVKAWAKLTSKCRTPEKISVLAEKKHAAVYRLHSVESRGTCVVAKRCPRHRASAEQTIYETIMPLLPTTTLNFYGIVEGIDDQSSWLFMEDAGDHRYSPRNPEHRILAAGWLGIMHTVAANCTEVSLPSRDTGHYLELLRSAQKSVEQTLSNPALRREDRTVFAAILSESEVIQGHWSHLEDFLAQIPRTIVHNDFIGQNIRIRINSTGSCLLPFDWGRAVWGSPAVDLAQSTTEDSNGYSANVDIVKYCSTIQENWQGFDIETTKLLANFGTIFWTLEGICSLAQCYTSAWAYRCIRHMKVYETELGNVMRLVGWTR